MESGLGHRLLSPWILYVLNSWMQPTIWAPKWKGKELFKSKASGAVSLTFSFAQDCSENLETQKTPILQNCCDTELSQSWAFCEVLNSLWFGKHDSVGKSH